MIQASIDPAARARVTSSRPLFGVRAGSALVFHDRRLLILQDDALSAIWVDPESLERVPVLLEGQGQALPKARKPDFEAAFVGPGREVTILGSGSAPSRRRAAFLDLESRDVRMRDLGPLFDAMAARLGTPPNVEGAMLDGQTLRLFHRGAGRAPSVVFDVSVEVLASSVVGRVNCTSYDLGYIDDVPLHFTDAVVCQNRTLYVAVAEDTPNAIDDGPIVGAAIGVLEGDRARFARLEDPAGGGVRSKIEGIALDPARGQIWAVTDPDDPDKPAELCTIELEGFF